MRPGTLRGRVALAAGVAIVLAVALLGAIFSTLVGRQLRSGLDDALRERAAQVARLSASAPALLTAPGALDAPIGGRQLSVQVVDRRGRIVARSQALGGRLLPAERPLALTLRDGRTSYADAQLGEEPLRLYVAPLADLGAGPAAGGAVVVSAGTRDIASTLRGFRLLLGGSALLAGTVAAAAALMMTRRALRPLERLSAGAEEIERTGDSSRRLPVPASQDEVGRLATTLNAMLATLGAAREVERRFIADASHELRTPLTALRGNAAFVARHGADAAVLADIEADAARLATLLDDLLALAREDAAAAPSDPVRLDELAHEVAEGDPLVRVDAHEPVLVRGDRAALERALANLVQNAHRHGPPEGLVSVAARRAGSRALLEVSDEGPGLRGAAARLAFTRFWRGAEARGRSGSGLGLAIVATTAERHGGRASVRGSRFTVDLPADSHGSLKEEPYKGGVAY